jgi:sterol desaturase/sphingolipid hydroxylase (fatty acid hydroxylase superfamily)
VRAEFVETALWALLSYWVGAWMGGYEVAALRLAYHFPVSLGCVALFIADDLVQYGQHRLAHRWRWWWFAHRVHHSARHVNLSVAWRASPLEMGPQFFGLAVLVLMGWDVWAVLLVRWGSMWYQHLMHSWPVRFPRVVRRVLIDPAAHFVHHSHEPRFYDRNFGAVLSVWDGLFGTAADLVPVSGHGDSSPHIVP